MSEWQARYLAHFCLPVINSGYKVIWPAAVNAVNPNANAPSFNIGNYNNQLELQYGVPDATFATAAYAWLGWPGHDAIVEVPVRGTDMSNAWTKVLDTVTVEGVATKALATAAELSCTRFNGHIIKTGSRPVDDENVGIQLTPCTMDVSHDRRIHVTVIDDWSELLNNGNVQ